VKLLFGCFFIETPVFGGRFCDLIAWMQAHGEATICPG